MNIRTANSTDIDKILILSDQIAKFHIDARPDWHDDKKRPQYYEFMKKSM